MLVLFRRLLDASRPHAWNRWVALFAATWYGVHTAIAETVNYLIARSDILSTLAVVLAVLMFFPFVGATLAVAWAVALTLMRHEARRAMRPAVAAAAIALLLVHVCGTWQRNVVWATEESLWLDVTRKSPRNRRGLMTYGVIQMGKGNLALADEYFNRAVQFSPQYAYLHVNLGVLKGAQQNPAEAERHFMEGQRLDPGNPVSYQYYARWLHSVGRTSEAIPMARRAVELSPDDAEAKRLLDDMRSPTTPEGWLSLSLAEYQAGRYQGCIDASLQVLQLRPDYAEAYNNLCAAENARGRFAEGAAACEQALAIKPDFPLARNNLAVANARLKMNSR